MEDLTPLTSRLELNNGTNKVEYVNDAAWDLFSRINGKLVGYKPAEPETLTPLANGKQISAYVLDPNAISNSDMENWLNGLTYRSVHGILMHDLFELSSGSSGVSVSAMAAQDSPETEVGPVHLDYPMITLSQIAGDIPVIYSAGPQSYMGMVNLIRGWQTINMDTMTAEAITTTTQLNLDNTYAVKDITESFAFLNGVALGCVEAEPGPTPTNYKEFGMPDAFESITLGSDISSLLSYNNIRIRLAVNGVETKTIYLTYSAGDINNGYQHMWSYKNDYTSTIDFAIALTNDNTCVCFANTQAETGTTIRIYPNNIMLPDQLLPLEVAESYADAEANHKLFSKIYFNTNILDDQEIVDIIRGTLADTNSTEILCGKSSVNVAGYMDNLIIDCGIFFERVSENNVKIEAIAFTPQGESP